MFALSREVLTQVGEKAWNKNATVTASREQILTESVREYYKNEVTAGDETGRNLNSEYDCLMRRMEREDRRTAKDLNV